MFAVTASLLVRNARAAGTLAALAGFLIAVFRADPPAGVLEALTIILPALEVTFFAFVVAFALDERPLAPLAAAIGFMAWGAGSFAAMWVLVLLTRAGIDAYVRLGGPPMMSFAH